MSLVIHIRLEVRAQETGTMGWVVKVTVDIQTPILENVGYGLRNEKRRRHDLLKMLPLHIDLDNEL